MSKSGIRLICVTAFFMHSILTAARLTGVITDKSTGQPIPDANIMVLNTQIGTVSKDGGYYFFYNLPDGHYLISVRVIGYASTVREISVNGDQIIDFELEPKAVEFDPVVITATLSEHRQSNVTVSADVLTKNRMNSLNGNTAGEIIESIAGVYSKSYDGFGGLNTPSIRGSQAAQVLVLMDGIRLNTAQGGSVDLNTIPLAAIDRIEVIKGGHSALLGSDAIGGAIHILTNDMHLKGLHYGFNATLGSFGTTAYSFRGSHQVGVLGFFAVYNQIQSDGDFKYRDTGSDRLVKRVNNDSNTGNLFLKGKFTVNTYNTVQFTFQQLHTEKGIAGNVNISPWTGLPQTTPGARSDSRRNTWNLESSHRITHSLELKTQTGYHSYQYRFQDPDSWENTNDLHKNDAAGISLQAIADLSSNLTATGGLSYQKDELSSTRFTGAENRTMKSIYGQIEYRQPLRMTHWTWIPAVRWDDYSDVGSQLSPKLGMMFSLGEAGYFALKGNIGKSYRVPTFEDLYWPSDEYTAGNPDLLPETGTSLDAGVTFADYTNGLLQAELTWFKNSIRDMIEWQPGDDYIWRPANVGRAEIRGLESGIKFRIPSDVVYTSIYFTKMKATNETEGSETKGRRLIYRPDQKWDIILGTKLGMMSAHLNYRFASKSFIDAANSASLKAYRLVNANLAAGLSISGTRFTLKIQGINLTDQKIFLSDGYPLPGREFRVSLGVEH